MKQSFDLRWCGFDGTMRVVLGVIAVCCGLGSPASGQEASNLRVGRLDNGMTVMMRPVPDAKVVAVEMFHRVGLFHEPSGKPQLANLTAYMVYQGPTENYIAGEAAATIKNRGIANAETLGDFVHFDYLVPSEDLDRTFQIAAERLTSLKFTDDVLVKARRDVLAEIDAVCESEIVGMVKFGLSALNQVLRFGKDQVEIYRVVNTVSNRNAREFYRAHYAAEDTIIVIAGGFDPTNAQQLVDKYFAPIEKSTSPAPPAWTLKRSVDVTWDLGVNGAYLVWLDPPKDAAEKTTLALFGNHLLSIIDEDPELRAITKVRFCTNQVYPAGEMPFWVYGEAKPDIPARQVAARLAALCAAAKKQFTEDVFNARRAEMAAFFSWDAISGMTPGDQPQAFAFGLGQEAVNLGVKAMLAGEMNLKDYADLVSNLDFPKAGKTIDTILAGDKRLTVAFTNTRTSKQKQKKP